MESMKATKHSSLLEAPEMLDEKSILKNKYPFKAIYIFGPAGSGKSYISSNLLGIPKDFVVSNPDERIEEVFPAFGISMKFANSETGGDADLRRMFRRVDSAEGRPPRKTFPRVLWQFLIFVRSIFLFLS